MSEKAVAQLVKESPVNACYLVIAPSAIQIIAGLQNAWKEQDLSNTLFFDHYPQDQVSKLWGRNVRMVSDQPQQGLVTLLFIEGVTGVEFTLIDSEIT